MVRGPPGLAHSRRPGIARLGLCRPPRVSALRKLQLSLALGTRRSLLPPAAAPDPARARQLLHAAPPHFACLPLPPARAWGAGAVPAGAGRGAPSSSGGRGQGQPGEGVSGTPKPPQSKVPF